MPSLFPSGRMKSKHFLLHHPLTESYQLVTLGPGQHFLKLLSLPGDEMLAGLLKNFLESVFLILSFRLYCLLFLFSLKVFLKKRMLRFLNLFFWFVGLVFVFVQAQSLNYPVCNSTSKLICQALQVFPKFLLNY